VRQSVTLTVRIPPGVAAGDVLTLPGEGNAGKRGARSGDLLIVIQEAQHPLFRREGADIHASLTVSFPEAALGATVEVPTVWGTASLQLKPGTQPGAVLRLPGQGLPTPDGRKRGDHYVHISIYVPEKLTTEERQLLERLAQSPNLQPPDHRGEKPRRSKGSFWEKVRQGWSS